MANCGRKRIIAAIMALAIVAGAAPAKPISDLIMPELSVSAAEASTSEITYAGSIVEVGGKLGVKFYFNVPENYEFANTAFVKLTCAGKSQTFNLNQGVKETNGLMFKTEIAAKQMGDVIKAEVFTSTKETKPVVSEEKSVQAYAEYMINNAPYNNDAKLVKMCKALLNYGAYAQKALNYNTTKLANANLSAADKALSSTTTSTLAKYEGGIVSEGDAPVVKKIAMISTSLESETELNVLLSLKDGMTVNNTYYECTDGANTYEYEKSTQTVGGVDYACIKIKGIAAKALGKDIFVTVSDASKNAASKSTIKCSALTYAYKALGDTTGVITADMKNLNVAFYDYNRAAVEYFDSERSIEATFQGVSSTIDKFDHTASKAYLETVTVDNKAVEKFIITVPAAIEDGYGVSAVTISYVDKETVKNVTMEADDYVIEYNDFGNLTAIIIDKDAVPSGAELVLNVKVSEKIGITLEDGDNGVDDDDSDDLTISHKNIFYGEEFKAVLSPADDMALPGTITVKETKDSSDVTLTADKDYKYDALTGEIVIYAPTGNITITGESVDSHIVDSKLYNLEAEMPTKVGSGFTTVLSVTDAENYKVPTSVSIYGTTAGNLAPGYYSVLNEDGKTRTYYDAGTKGEVEVTVASNATAAQKEAAQLEAIANEVDDDTYYVIDINADGTAKLSVNQIDADNEDEGIMIVARATQYYSVKYSIDSTLAYSSAEIYKNTTTKKLVTKAVDTTVNNNEDFGPIYVALATDEEEVDIPTSITVKMGGKELDATTDYSWRALGDGEYTHTGADKVVNYVLDVYDVTGELEITAAATEMFTIKTNLTQGLDITNASGGELETEQSVGNFIAKLVKVNDDIVLPSSIKVTVTNGKTTTELEDAIGYTYDRKTGEIEVFGLVKGDVLTITAAGAYTCTAYGTSSTKVKIVADNASPLVGDDVTFTVTLPKYTDLYTDTDNITSNNPAISMSSVEVTVDNVAISNEVSTTEPYYVYTAGTGSKLGTDTLVVYNITGNVVATVNAAAEYDVTVAATDDPTLSASLAGAKFTLDADKVHDNTAKKIKVTASGLAAGIELDAAVYVGESTTALDKTTDADSNPATTNDITTNYTWTQDTKDSNVYILEIVDGSKVTGDIAIEIIPVAAKYDLTLNADHLTVAKAGGIEIVSAEDLYNHNDKVTYGVTADAGYKLPETAVVKVGGNVVANAYSLDKNEDGDLTGTATIKLTSGITGDVEITIVALVDVQPGDETWVVSEPADDACDVSIKVGTTDITADDTYYYNPSSTSPLSIDVMLTGTEQYMYKLSQVELTCADATGSDITIIDKATYDANVETHRSTLANYKGNDATVIATYTQNYEDAVNTPYYTSTTKTYTVYNANGLVKVNVTVDENVSVATTSELAGSTTAKAFNVVENGVVALKLSETEFEKVVPTSGNYDLKKLMVEGEADSVITEVETTVNQVEVKYYLITGLTQWSPADGIKIVGKSVDLTTTLSKCSVDTAKTNVAYYSATNKTITLKAEEGYNLPATVEIKLGTGTSATTLVVDDDYTYTNNVDGTATIEFNDAVDDVISITATATVTP